MNLTKTIVVALAVSLMSIGGVSLVFHTSAPVEAPVEVEDLQSGALSGPDVNSYMNVNGAFSQGGGLSTVLQIAEGTHTLTFAEMSEYNVITFTASTTQGALTATLPATTTFPLGTKAGSYRSWVIENPFTAAATTTTIAAGTGIDLQEPDGQNVVIGINNYAYLTCFRLADSDIVCRVDETIPAD